MGLSDEGEQLIAILERLEQELRRLDLWGEHSPDEQALSSIAPFACDSMDFCEWLQWLALPRLHQLAQDRSRRLPLESEITTAAEVYLESEGRAAPTLVNIMHALDDELNARWVEGG